MLPIGISSSPVGPIEPATRTVRLGGIGGGARILRGGAIQFDDAILEVVQLEAIARTAKRVGQDDVGASLDVGAVHILHALRAV
jgi:hypothetical protein